MWAAGEKNVTLIEVCFFRHLGERRKSSPSCCALGHTVVCLGFRVYGPVLRSNTTGAFKPFPEEAGPESPKPQLTKQSSTGFDALPGGSCPVAFVGYLVLYLGSPIYIHTYIYIYIYMCV